MACRREAIRLGSLARLGESDAECESAFSDPVALADRVMRYALDVAIQG